MIEPGLYRHCKGKPYRVWATAHDSETLAPLAVYQALYGNYSMWVRPAHMFSETVEREGRSVLRFEKQEAPPPVILGNEFHQGSVLQPGIYRHFKGGLYRLWHEATHSESLKRVVVYQALQADKKVWVRELEQFLRPVEHDGKILQRFVHEPNGHEPTVGS